MKKIIVAYLFTVFFCACTKEKNAPAVTQVEKQVNETTVISNATSQSLTGSGDTSTLTKKKKVVKIKYPKPKR